MKVVIIGGVAAGPKAASRIVRLKEDAEVILIEKGTFLSYAGCGLPYYVADVVKEQAELMSTPIGVVRDPVFFQNVKNVRVFNQTEALGIDRNNKTVTVKNLSNNEEQSIVYDKLVLSTGSSPVVPPLKGVDLRNIFTLQKVEDAESIKQTLAQKKAKDVVIVGGGLIGVEMTESLVSKGCRVTIVERLPHILPMLDVEMASFVENHLEQKGVRVMTATEVKSFQGEESVSCVETDKGSVPCDFVIMSVGVRPNSSLAKEAGLEIGKLGGIRVNEFMQTSDENIYAAGDCVEVQDMITKQWGYVPLGSTANKQGRVAANHICGHPDKFEGVLGSMICKVFDFNVGRTGLSEAQAKQAGFDTEALLSPSPDKAHFYPGAKLVTLKLVFDKGNRKLLGVQAVGLGTADKRIDVAATAITAGMTVDQVAQLDLSYAPPYSPAMDNIITAANIARNKLDGLYQSLSPEEVAQKMEKGEDFVLLDVRSQKEYDELAFRKGMHIPLGKLRGALDQVPADKEIIVFCKISLRGYEAARILQAGGFARVKVMDGGIVSWPSQYKKYLVK